MLLDCCVVVCGEIHSEHGHRYSGIGPVVSRTIIAARETRLSATRSERRVPCFDLACSGLHPAANRNRSGLHRIAPDAVETDRPRAGFPPNCWRLFVCHARSVLSFSSPHSFSVLAKVRVLLMFVAFHVYIFDAQTCVALTRGQGEYV